MSDRKLAKAVQTLFSQMQKMSKALTKGFMKWLLRTAMIANQRFQSPAAGFVLPTVVLLLLVVSLTVGALVFRAYSRSAQVIGESQQRVIYNAATPAIDRARAKLETLFDPNRDNRYPGGVPAEDYLTGMLRNDGSYSVSALPNAAVNDQYTLLDETRVNLDGAVKSVNINGVPTPVETRGVDNAWVFRTDTNGDGAADATVVYSILLQTPTDTTAGVAGSGMVSTSDKAKADSLWVRQGPLSNQLRGNCSVPANSSTSSAAQGWFADLSTSSALRKNFQVDALVIPDTVNKSGTFTTLEVQQDRQLDRGNKWGAWFRNDLEIFPGPPFNWNGAMHTEGSLMVSPENGFDAYLVSSQASCLMSTANNSEITVTTSPTSQTEDFVGLALSGRTNINSYTGSSNIHIWPATTNPAQPSQIATLADGTDSATKTSPVIQTALDPVLLLTRDVSQARGSSSPSTPKTNRTAPQDYVGGNWSLPANASQPRIYNKTEPKPYVDDLYRADDRWGPKPRYNAQIAPQGANQAIGTLITQTNVTNGTDYGTLVGNSYDPANPATAASVGLDGYWERRAFNEGLRIIVGQRLELGNAAGWVTQPATPLPNKLGDSLNPPIKYGAGSTLSTTSSGDTLTHEARQRRMLRDNLAAVQGTAIYHTDNPNTAGVPVACLASTAHPGTSATIKNSTTFGAQSFFNSSGAPVTSVLTDFLSGNGTNGWEFSPLPGSATPSPGAYGSAVASTASLGKALRNLANFAGDPKGYFPPAPDSILNVTHPYPQLTMWGNFSELRRTLDRLDGTNGSTVTTYDNLSFADKTNLHTAICTLGMLAYNVNNAQSYHYSNATNEGNGSAPGLSKLSAVLSDLVDGITNNGEVKDPTTGAYFTGGLTGTASPGANYATLAPTSYGALPPEAFIQAILNETGITPTLSAPDRASLANIARIVYEKQQIERDRVFGFKDGSPALVPPAIPASSWDPTTGSYGGTIFKTACDPESFPLTTVPAISRAKQKAALALALCEKTPRYPSLFYLFPKVNHDHAGSSAPMATLTGYTTQNNNQQLTPPESYISDTYIANTANPTTATGNRYQVVGGITTPDDFVGVVLTPKDFSFATAGTTGWTLPNSAPQTITKANVSTNLISTVNSAGASSTRAVGFLDRGVFNGREMMTTRMMDLDLGLLRDTPIAAGKPWLPISGIVYAFREDAVREDAIARPPSTQAPAATNTTSFTASAQKDPALATNNGINLSTKQVDYVPDPDRRPHGFRLRNGSQIKRNNSFGLAATANIYGLSFFTDSPVYIQGDFNLHQDGGDNTAGTRLEEFDQVLPNGIYNQTQFYGRTDRNANFAKTGDRWRPTEILADAISILSNTFCDGSIEDTFTTAGQDKNATISGATRQQKYGCSNANLPTSFLNQNRPETVPTTTPPWMREIQSDPNSPVKIDRNGNPLQGDGTPFLATAPNYYQFSDEKPLMPADVDTQVNSIIVSGIVPSRTGQAYGGMHNFPRFLESWDGQSLRFAGSFLQLSFSNSATAPFDQDAWEPLAATYAPSPSSTSDQVIGYYFPPNRVWGYDPALQLAPAGPAAARFVVLDKSRNEFYSELPANDPFINKLCTAAKTSGVSGVPTNVNCPS